MPGVGNKAAIVLSVVLILTFSASAFWFDRNIRRTQAQVVEVATIVHGLEGALGFGGLIHHFKNAVLRPAEARYQTQAEAAAVQALTLLDRFEALTATIGSPTRLDGLRDVTELYRSRLRLIAEMHARGESARRIDTAVRIDDQPALEELTAIQIDLLQTLQTRLAVNRHLMLLLLAASALLLGIFLLFVAHQQRLRDRLSSLQAIEAINRELSERNRLLTRATDAHRQFAGIAAHDLKAPARQIAMLADLAAEDRHDAELLSADLLRIRDVAQRMRSIIDALLQFTRTLYQAPNPEPVDMRAAALHALNRLQPENRDSQLPANVTVEDLPDAIADQELITLVFTNLIGNAIKYRKPDEAASIRVSGTRRDNDLLYQIEDQGIGIDARYAERIFEPLRRLHGEKSNYSGHGIGLALVRSIIEAHGGAVWLDANAENTTRFCFTLPRDPEVLYPGGNEEIPPAN